MTHRPVSTPHDRRANPIHPRKPAHAHIRGPAKWLVMAYMAGDNDLESFAVGDIKEMEKVGSRPGEVDVVVQIDRAAGHDRSDGDWQGTRRYYVTRSTDKRRINSRLLADLVGDLKHRHQARVHADQVDLAAEELVRGAEHALQLLVVEAVARAVVVRDPARLGVELEQALAGGVKERAAQARVARLTTSRREAAPGLASISGGT